MNHAKIRIREEDLLKLVLDFLTSRNLNVSMRTLEKESGVVNSPYTEDILFLRELILDGDWDEVLLFAQPFEGLVEFDSKQFKYLILKQKFLELLSLKSHVVGKKAAHSIEDVMKTLNLLEENCPSKEEYSNLCWLLTVPNLSERSEFKNWTLDNSRLKCFTAVLDVVCRVPTLHKKAKQKGNIAVQDRLLQLVVKGLFYETCIEYCQSKATGTKTSDTSSFSVRTNVLQGIADDYSANLLSWVRNLDDEVFAQPFEQVSVDIVLEKLAKLDRNLRHSIDIPKKNKREDDGDNIIFRSLSNLDPEMLNRKATVSKNKKSPLVSSTLPLVEANLDLKNEKKSNFGSSDAIENYTVTPRGVLQGDRQKRKIIGDMRVSDVLVGHSSEATHEKPNKGIHKSDTKERQEDYMANHFVADSNFVESKTDTSNEAKTDLSSIVEPETVASSTMKHSTNQDSFEVEERKRRESVMKKLEEYENRKKMMQLQLEQMNQGLQQSEMPSESLASAGITSKPIQMSDPPLHRQYVTAKDLVTDYDSSRNQPQSDHFFKVGSGDKFEKRKQSSGDDPAPAAKKIEKKDGFVQGTDHANSVEGPDHKTAKIDGPNYRRSIEPVTTPRDNGFFVNLSDGSGKMSTSTPKAKRQEITETPPPEASPVKPLGQDANTPKTVLKKTFKNQLQNKQQNSRKIPNKTERNEEDLDIKSNDIISHEHGKENVSKDGNYPRKGPVINGVRRTLVTSPQHVIQPSHAAEAKIIGNLKTKPLKTATGGDGVKSPLDTKHVEEKPLAKNVENIPNIKGPGPKIKTRDGSKVLVTELLKSREEIKNATANKQRYGSPELEEKIDYQEDIKAGQVKESENRLNFIPVCLLEDSQAIRAVSFHPDGKLFAIGSNSKVLRVCTIKSFQPVNAYEGEGLPPPSIVFKRNKYHKGSIYCMTWNPLGDIIATGSNDKSIKLLRFDPDNFVQESTENELNIHNGTVRELSFVPDKPAILVSGGAGDGGVHVTDCSTCQTIGTLRGHSGNVMAVYAGEGDIIATGSTDNTLRLWDLRSHRCIDVVLVGDSSPASVALNGSGSCLASGQEDGSILLYDISAGRTLQSFRLHQEDCRSVRFSPDSKYLLTGSYDGDVSLLHTEGDLEVIVPQHYKVAAHKDKVIQCRWHPNRYSFLSSSADRTAVIWSSDVDRNLLFS